jgi:predicted ester cyclase
MLDFTYTVDAMSVDEDRVWAQITASGTHTNTLQLSDGLSIPASMNTATWSVTVVSRFEDGKIAETWVQADTLDLMQQIGAMPMLQEFTTEEQNIERVRQYVDAVNARDFDAAFEQTYAESWVFYDPYTRASYNARPSDSTNYLRGIERSFPDFTFTIEHIAAAGNIVFVQSTFTGTFEASFVPTGTSAVCGATNEEASWEEIRILRFEDGFVVEEWLYIDDPMANQPELYCAR